MSLDDHFDWEDIVGDSNGPAHQTTEERHGPPLEYVAEKARHSLEHLHDVLRSSGRGGIGRSPGGYAQPGGRDSLQTLASTRQPLGGCS